MSDIQSDVAGLFDLAQYYLVHTWGEGIILGVPGTFANETTRVNPDRTHRCMGNLPALLVEETFEAHEVEVFGEGIVLGHSGTFANEVINYDDEGAMTEESM